LAKLVETDAAGGPQTSLRTTPAGTEVGLVMGTAGYTSPEQVRAQPADHRSDVFSFGAILYEMLSGTRAFKGGTLADTMSAILSADPPELTETNRAIPPGIDRIVRHCLEKSPDERFQSARDIAFDLDSLSNLSGSATGVLASGGTRGRGRTAVVVAAVASGVALAAIAALLVVLRTGQTPPPEYHQITFRRGHVETARFAPDGAPMVYAAAWEGRPIESFSARTGSLGERALGIPEARILGISSTGEMALLVKLSPSRNWIRTGTLARAPLDGGAPREVLQNVGAADWSPDGKQLAISRYVPEKERWRLEYPIGKVLYETTQWISHVRVSPTADRIAFLEHPPSGDDRGVVGMLDLAGRKAILTPEFPSIQGTAWSVAGDEIWFTASRTGNGRGLFAVSQAGKWRPLSLVPGSLLLADVSRDGRVLLSTEAQKGRLMVLPPGETVEHDLSWLDYPLLRDLSADGKTILFDEEGEGGGPNYSVFVRGTDGGPAVRLGEGYAVQLSPDGKWAMTVPLSDPPRIVLVPIGAGEPRTIASDLRTKWLPDSKSLLLCGAEPGKRSRCSIYDIESGRSRPLTPEGIDTGSSFGQPVSPDGKWVLVVRNPERQWLLWSIEGGEPHPVTGLEGDDFPFQWLADGKSVYVTSTRAEDVLPRRVYTLDLATGKQFLRSFGPSDLTGIGRIAPPYFSRDGRAYAYRYSQVLSDLYVADGIK
jgi:eukaryotic-like serine/threonine-protein kinase